MIITYNTFSHKYIEAYIMICVIGVLLLWMSVCVMIRLDELSWHIFMSFFVVMFESLFMCFVRMFSVIFFTIFHVRGFSSSCICVSSCLVLIFSKFCDDLNIVSVQCVVVKKKKNFRCVRVSCDDIGLEKKIYRR